ncbi:MAG: bifunctional phosphopantothenoylcysteine decarboxylase/phosphopantothenate--cysteine ligase CoaBC [Clostridia bacterium]|nr:bifunctional phosphopantothenoylcysteine decarboxylase/phosphopantothenate--cysteine ligase CoaBC [Clostridia bacterium]
MLKGKTVVLGVTGGIAAYKAAEITSRFVKLGADVKVIMTEHAQEFVGPLTFQAISNNPVVTDMFAPPTRWDVEHIALAKAANLFVIAPATASVMGKINAGIADDMLTTTVMATKAPVLIAPAMNVNMYESAVNQRNMVALKELGYHFVEPGEGFLACGDLGKGRLEDPEKIVNRAVEILLATDELKGKKVLVTAGPTREAIDPVRYLTNHSSGKMGYAIAREARLRGADVVLVSGVRDLAAAEGVKVIEIDSANDMYEAVMANIDADIIVKAAAVADYRPAAPSDIKIKKMPGDMTIPLTRNKDILFELGMIKTHQYLVGFAAETNDVIENAKQKMVKKNLDLIVANDVTAEGAGFKSNTNVVTILRKNGEEKALALMSKEEVASEILDTIIEDMNA